MINFDWDSIEKEALQEITTRIESVLHVIGNKLVADAVLRLREGDKIAFGNLINSIAYDIKRELPFSYLLKFGANAKTNKGVSYAKFVEEGRVTGRKPPYEPILAWAGRKRHRLGNAFFGDMPVSQVARRVQWSLKKKPIAPYPFLSWAIEENKDFIEQRIKEALGL